MRSLLRSALWSSHTYTSNWCAFPGRFIPSSSLKKSRALAFFTRRHGFNKQTPSLFVQDTIKSSLLNLILEIILYLIIQLILRHITHRTLFILWSVLVLFSIVLNLLYPRFLLPLFNRLTPLPPSSLSEQIQNLASRVGFRVNRVQLIDSSRRTGHSNAAAYGLFGVNGILIADTLLTQLSEREILAVLGHELGHWRFAHTYRMLAVNSLVMLAMIESFSLFAHNQAVFASFGFADMPTLMGFVLFMECIWSAVEEICDSVVNVVSRRQEDQADAFATELGYGKELKTALVKLNVENASTLKVHWLVSMLRNSHPSLLERCKHISEVEKKKKIDFVFCSIRKWNKVVWKRYLM
ncbi:CaaX prenyl protease [Blastocystis hominis]|uniref:CAAX prenyl protease n=1 Tax=Blastocystis hominis TaxID=12968 RepID=D8LWK2_BLAHO|nr:CaaX prenyl protease [Blastocystis hominis]CBK20191.2 CaaX prenyl protease [Blastocystis hominis]|eukprot:XP_012894239.1 CaaX prenyl protease [Blastocystis hominis]